MLTTNSSLMDGINRHILTVAPAVNRLQGYEVAVCSVFPRAELAESLDREGVRTFSLYASSGHDLKIFYRFYKIMREYQPDIIHSHVMALYEKILLSALFRSKKYISTVHGIRDKVTRESVRMKVERWLNSIFPIHYAAYCYVSNGVRQHLCGDKEQKGRYTIYNPLHFEEKLIPKSFSLHKIIGVASETPIIGTCCRLAAVKNPPMFTRVMCGVLQQNVTAHAVVLGDGDEDIKKELLQIVLASHVSDRFHFLGYRQDAPDLVRDFNCFVMTSISEGMPTSILEAIANKTPFAMMEGFGGLKDIAELNSAEGPIGIVVPKGDVDSLVSGILTIIANPDYAKLLADTAFRTGQKLFDIVSVAKQLLHVYNIVMSKTNA